MNNHAPADVDQPATQSIIAPWIDPRHEELFSFRRYATWIRGFALLTIVGAGVWTAFSSPLDYLLIGLELAWAAIWFVRIYFLGRTREGHPNAARFRYVVTIVAIGVLLGMDPTPRHTSMLWLLCFVPVLTVGVDLDRLWALGVILACSLLALFSSFAPIEDLPDQSWLAEYGRLTWRLVTETDLRPLLERGALRAFVVLFVAFHTYLLSRSLAYLQKYTQRLLERSTELGTGIDQATPETIAARFAAGAADLFTSPPRRSTAQSPAVIANVLTVDYGERTLRFAGSSAPAGQTLVAERFEYPLGKGLTGWAASGGRPLFLNDTAKRDHDSQPYYFHPAFPHTRSELAVPVSLDGRVIAVLDLQSPRPNAFGTDDLWAVQVIADQLARTLELSSSLATHSELAGLYQRLASGDTVRNLESLLAAIGAVARKVLEADLIGYYVVDPANEKILGPYYSGEHRAPVPHTAMRDLDSPDNPVSHLLSVGEVRLFPDAVDEELLVTARECHLRAGIPPFVVREGITSCAAVPLKIGAHRVGLMFINYRRRQDFTFEQLDAMRMLAPQAAMAIQSCVRDESNAVLRRKEFGEELHDGISHSLVAVEAALSKVVERGVLAASTRERLTGALMSVKSASKYVGYLMQGKEWHSLQMVFDELRATAGYLEKSHGVAIDLELPVLPPRSLSPLTGRFLRELACEALNNAAKHAARSHAHHIRLIATLEGSELEIVVVNDGDGFDKRAAHKGRGLNHMRERAEFLHGSLDIVTRPARGAGTCVIFRMSLKAAGEAARNGDGDHERVSQDQSGPG